MIVLRGPPRAANRRNAQLKRTGPRHPGGEGPVAGQRAEARPLRLGRRPRGPPRLIQERATEIYQALKPYTDYQAWHVDRAAVLSLRIERAERMERRARDKAALRAELTWEDDRRLEAEVLGEDARAAARRRRSRPSAGRPQGLRVADGPLGAAGPRGRRRPGSPHGPPSRPPWPSTSWPPPGCFARGASPARRSTSGGS